MTIADVKKGDRIYIKGHPNILLVVSYKKTPGDKYSVEFIDGKGKYLKRKLSSQYAVYSTQQPYAPKSQQAILDPIIDRIQEYLESYLPQIQQFFNKNMKIKKFTVSLQKGDMIYGITKDYNIVTKTYNLGHGHRTVNKTNQLDNDDIAMKHTLKLIIEKLQKGYTIGHIQNENYTFPSYSSGMGYVPI